MKIALLIDDRYPQSGGTTRVVERLAQSISAAGHIIRIFCPTKSQADAPGAQIVRTLRLPNMPEGTLWPSATDNRRLAEFKPDIIHTHSERGAFTWALRASRALDVPHIHTFHADYTVLHPYYPMANVLSLWLALTTRTLPAKVTLPKQLADYYEQSDRFLKYDWLSMARFAANTDAYTTPSPRVFKFFQATGIADHGRLIPFGIEPVWLTTEEVVNQRHGTPVIISVGRLDAEKRVDVVIEAFRQLRSNGTAAKLWIVGTGTVAHQLQEQAQACGFAEDITFHGLVKSGDDLRQLYRQADVFALGSYHYETQGLVLLEAAAAGLPIVYSDERLEVGVTKANSLRTPPDSKGYAQGFRQLCEDHALRRRMGLASLSEARAYPLDKVMTEIQAVYTQAIQKPAKAA